MKIAPIKWKFQDVSLGFGPSCILTVVDIRMPAIQLLRHSLQHFCGLGLPCQGKV